MTRIESLRKMASAATFGPWKLGYNDGSGVYDEEAETFSLTDVDDNCVLHARLADSVFDAKYIAAVSPAVMNELLDCVEQLANATESVFTERPDQYMPLLREALSRLREFEQGER